MVSVSVSVTLFIIAMLVSVFITSPDTHGERRLDTDLTVGQLKVRGERRGWRGFVGRGTRPES